MSDVKRTAILEAGTQVFLTHGFGNASMDAIARAAAVSKATIYSHFDSKHGLFGAIIQASCQAMMDAARAAEGEDTSEPVDSPPEVTLTRVGRAFLDLLLAPESLPLYRAVVAEAVRFPELGQVFYQMGPEPTAATLAAYLDAQNARGTLRVPDPRLAAEQFYGMVLGHSHMKMLFGMATATPPAEVKDRLVKGAVEVFIAGYRPN